MFAQCLCGGCGMSVNSDVSRSERARMFSSKRVGQESSPNELTAAILTSIQCRCAYRRFGKRLFDITLALVMLPIILPTILVLLAIVSTDRGKPLFRHRRVGYGGKDFTCYKIRTMVPNAESVLQKLLAEDPEIAREWAKHRKLRRDPRITTFGRVLRRTGLDELPQILNVILGSMSFVGPRPMTRDEFREYAEENQIFGQAYTACRPGVTGSWQVTGRRDADVPMRLALDIEYAQSCSFKQDLWIIFRTVPEVLGCKGS